MFSCSPIWGWGFPELNNISVRGLERLPRDLYEVDSEIGHPDAVLLRSADMHAMEIPASVLAVGRAGAGTNNVPVAKLSRRGIPVFNAPGANANAVKELVLAGLFLASRNVCQAWGYVRSLEGDDHAIEEAVEKGKKKFVDHELPGRTLGVVGLGAIGVEVANAALGLRMKVLGYDPQITVQRAWQLSSGLAKQLMHSHGEQMVYEAVATMGESAGVESERGSKAGAEKFAKGLLESQLANGWNSEVKVEGGKVTLINHTCPCYSGMREAGLTHEQTKNMCYAWWRRFPDSAKSENSTVIGYHIEKYRDNESGICHEVFEFRE